MANALILTDGQITQGTASLISGKLTESQVDDLITMFRNYLGFLASDYPIESTLTIQEDNTNSKNRCAKLAACLLLWQDDQFLNGGFAATNSNRTGFNYSIDETGYLIFKYAFGLFWDIPIQLDNKFLSGGNYVPNSRQGKFIEIL